MKILPHTLSPLSEGKPSNQREKVPFSSFRQETASFLLFSRRGPNYQVEIVREPTGRVRAHLNSGGVISQIPLRGFPSHLPASEVKKASQLLQGSYIVFHREVIEVRPRGCGGVKRRGKSQTMSQSTLFMVEGIGEVPGRYLDRLSLQRKDFVPVLIENPVRVGCGHTFEEKVIRKWVEEGHQECPLKGCDRCKEFDPDPRAWQEDRSLKTEIEEWRIDRTKAARPRALREKQKAIDYEAFEDHLLTEQRLCQRGLLTKVLQEYEEVLGQTDKIEHYARYVKFLENQSSPKRVQGYVYLARLYEHELREIKRGEQEDEDVFEERKKDLRLSSKLSCERAQKLIEEMPEEEKFRYSTSLEETAKYADEVGDREQAIERYVMLIEMAKKRGNKEDMERYYNALLTLEEEPGTYHVEYLGFLTKEENEKAAEIEKKILDFWRAKSKEVDDEVETLEGGKKKRREGAQWIQISAREINLSGCSGEAVRSALEKQDWLSRLTVLTLCGCEDLRDEDLPMKKLSGLKEIDLSGCKGVTGSKIVEVLKRNPRVQKLVLDGNTQLGEEVLGQIFEWGQNLTYLSLKGCTQLSKKQILTAIGERRETSTLRLVFPSGRSMVVDKDEEWEEGISEDVASWRKMGALFLRVNKYEKGTAYYMKVVEKAKADFKGNKEELEAMCEKIQKGEEVFHRLEILGDIFRVLGERKEAMMFFEEALKVRKKACGAEEGKRVLGKLVELTKELKPPKEVLPKEEPVRVPGRGKQEEEEVFSFPESVEIDSLPAIAKVKEMSVIDTAIKALQENKIKSLDLSNQHLGDWEGKELAKALEANQSLEELNLRSNQIGDEGAKALANALEANHFLHKLELAKNPMTQEGESAIKKAIEKNLSLRQGSFPSCTFSVGKSSVNYN